MTAAAPDAASATAGRKLAGGVGAWSDCGTDEVLVWGACQGSGKNPYRVLVDTAGPRYKCSCPSRKFPCKHALGLLFLWAEHRLPDGTPAPEDARQWGSRPGAAEPAAEPTAEQQAAAAKRAADREAKVEAGLAELDRWLTDQVTTGLARAWSDPYPHFEQAAARMIDAQAPGIASRLARLVAVAASGPGWPERMLEEFALLRLLIRGWQRRATLPEDLRQTVRTHVGFPTPVAQVLTRPAVRRNWLVTGLVDVDDPRLSSRRVWLRSLDEQPRWAVVLSYAAPGQTLDSSLVPGLVLDAELHYYPGAGVMRAAVGERHAEREYRTGTTLTATDLAEPAGRRRELLAQDPWADTVPAVLRGRVLRAGEKWALSDESGRQATLTGAELDRWRLTGLLAGRPGIMAGEWSGTGFRPTSVFTADGLVLL